MLFLVVKENRKDYFAESISYLKYPLTIVINVAIPVVITSRSIFYPIYEAQ